MRRKRWRQLLQLGGAAWALGLLFTSRPAQGQNSSERSSRELARTPTAARANDGVYGRFDGDLAWALGGGAELGFSPASPRLMATAALRYYSFIGWYGSYRESLRNVDPLSRGASTGILLEPLFLLRWSMGATTGSQFWDLAIDSIGLSVGAHFEQAQGAHFGSVRGLETGVGAGVPLMGSAKGLWLRSRAQVRSREDGSLGPVLWLTLEWQNFLETGLTGARGRAL